MTSKADLLTYPNRRDQTQRRRHGRGTQATYRPQHIPSRRQHSLDFSNKSARPFANETLVRFKASCAPES